MPKSKGFTLIEVLIAMFIFAIIAVIASSVLYTVSETKDITNKQSHKLNQLQLAVILLRKDFSQMVERPVRDGSGRLIPSVVTSDNTVEFTRIGIPNILEQAQHSSLQRVKYEFTGNKLIRKTWLRLDRSPNEKPSQQIVLSNISEFRLTYLGTGANFHQHWPPETETNKQGVKLILPRAVLMKLKIKAWGEFQLLIPIRI